MSDQDFSTVLARLRSWRSEVVQELGNPEKQQEGVRLKHQLDRAIGCLELCRGFDVRPDSKVVVIPAPETLTPSSEFRLIEDHETDNREQWTEVRADGAFIRPLPGSLIIESPPRR